MNKQNINQHLCRVFFALAIVGVLLTLPNAQAAQPIPASGSTTDRECVVGNVPNGPNTIITLNIKATLTGTLTGTWCGTERDVVFPDGSETIHASGVFTGTVSGKSGTAVFTLLGEADKASPLGTFGGVGAAVTWVMDQGTGGLAGLHGHGAFGTLVSFAQGTGCGSNTNPCSNPGPGYDFMFTLLYSGQIQFAP